jgi:antitoxin ChpS
MTIAYLRRAGGSTVVTVPDAVLEEAGLTSTSSVTLEWDVAAKAIVMRRARPRYTMAELLAQCDPDAALTDEDVAWLGEPPVGAEWSGKPRNSGQV